MKIRKGFFSVLCAALAAAVLSGAGSVRAVQAADETGYTMSGSVEESYTAQVGETLVIPLKVSSTYDMRGLVGKLNGNYDSSILEFEKAEYTDGIPSGLESVAGGNFGFITSGSFKNGTVNLEFKVLKCAPDPVPVTIKDLYASVQIEKDDGSTTTVSTDKITLTTEVTVEHPESEREETIIKEPTCTEKGEKSVKCKLCGADLGTVEIPATGHTDGEWVVKKEATCTEKGSKELHCSVCDAVIKTEDIPAAGHKFGEKKTIKEATCTETGETEAVCSVCGETIKETIPKKAHVSDDGKVTKEATCAEEGEKTYTCKNCGQVLKTEKIAKTTDHVWEVTTDTDKDGWKVVKKATSTEAGSKERVCKICGTKETKAIAKLAAAGSGTGTLTGKKGTTTGTSAKTTSGTSTTSAAKTGDTANVMEMMVLFLAAAAVAAGAAVVLIRRRRRA